MRCNALLLVVVVLPVLARQHLVVVTSMPGNAVGSSLKYGVFAFHADRVRRARAFKRLNQQYIPHGSAGVFVIQIPRRCLSMSSLSNR